MPAFLALFEAWWPTRVVRPLALHLFNGRGVLFDLRRGDLFALVERVAVPIVGFLRRCVSLDYVLFDFHSMLFSRPVHPQPNSCEHPTWCLPSAFYVAAVTIGARIFRMPLDNEFDCSPLC